MGRERRIFPRLSLHRLIIDAKQSGDVAAHKAEVVNVSAGGLCVLRKFTVTMGEEITFTFHFRSGSLSLAGGVVRTDGREVGIKFIGSEDEIARFVDAFNDEMAGTVIRKRDGSRLVVPGNDDEGNFSRGGPDDMFDPDKE